MSQPDLIRDVIDEVMNELGLRERVQALRALLNWREAVGDTVANAAYPEALKGGKVFVAVKSSAWIQELTFQKQTVLNRLNEYAGAPIFTEIIFRVQPRSRKKSPEERDTGSFAARDLPEPELDTETVARLHTLTEPITDPELRARVTEYLVSLRKLQLARKQQGWRECKRCACLHPAETSEECPFCRGELT